MKRLISTLLSWTISALLCATAQAQTADSSNSPYRLVIGFAPGGALDTLARAVAEELKGALKQPVIVDNRPGGSSRLAIEYVKSAKPDGRTILLGSTPPFVLFPMTYDKLSYDVNRDFAAVALLANVPAAITTSSQQPYKTFADYANWLKKNPRQNMVGMTNLGGALHFSVIKLGKALGTDLEAVTYKGGAPLVTDIMGGHIPLGVDALASQLELARAGRVRILAVAGTKRLAWVPDVPTLKEFNIDAFDMATVPYGAFVPAGTPPETVKALEAAFVTAMQSSGVRSRLDHVGLEVVGLPAAALTKRMNDERAFWAPIVKASGFKSTD